MTDWESNILCEIIYITQPVVSRALNLNFIYFINNIEKKILTKQGGKNNKRRKVITFAGSKIYYLFK